MKNKQSQNILIYVEFKGNKSVNWVTGFCINETDIELKIASTYGNQGFTDIVTIKKSIIIRLNKLSKSKKLYKSNKITT